MDYKYKLALYKGPQSRLVCPSCGRREFVPYVDSETGEILHETCGRCNRESKCGYHLTPSQYFQQNPGARPPGEAWNKPPAWFDKRKVTIATAPKPQPTGTIDELPKEIVEKTISLKHPSNLVKYLSTIFDPFIVEELVLEYGLGTTKQGETIFYEIDRKGRYRGGKIIQYNPETGHRVKGTDHPVRWAHTDYLRLGYIPQGWTMTQCLFGEHLLDKYPDKMVCLVEAEKSAIIGSAFAPDCVWVATGGKTQMGDKLDVLQGRQIVVYPDVDAFDKWTEAFAKRPYLSAVISTFLEDNCTEEDREAQVDIADLLIRWKLEHDAAVPSVPSMEGTEHPQPSFRSDNPIVRDVAKYFSPEVMPEVAALIEDLDLVPVSVSWTKPTTDEDSNT